MTKPIREAGDDDDADRPQGDTPSSNRRRAYTGPVLHRYGTVGKLTRSGTKTGADGGSKTMKACL